MSSHTSRTPAASSSVALRIVITPRVLAVRLPTLKRMDRTEHLLAVLMEEAAEVQQEVCKALRFGLHHLDPKTPEGPDNVARIAQELAELIAMADWLQEEGILPARPDVKAVKRERVERLMLQPD